jgi:hypothetical protein
MYRGGMEMAVNRLRQKARGKQQVHTKQLSNRKVTMVWRPERRVK